jgi:hypothetical protein
MGWLLVLESTPGASGPGSSAGGSWWAEARYD